jgi:hypothetical protein
VPLPLPLPLRRARIALVVAAMTAAGAASAVDPPTGVVFSAGVGGGTELGMDKGQQAGVGEAELSLGWEHAATGLRPEVAVGIGLAPDNNLAFRPGIRWVFPDQPIQIRAALDWSTARDKRSWRWLLLGGAFELRWTSAFSLFTGLDIGFPLGARAGLPLLIRGGASFRF